MTALATNPQSAPLAPKGPPRTMADLLMSKKEAMAAVATRHLSPEKLIKIVGVTMSRVPKLAQCTPLSTLSAVMTCAELGLAPSTLGTAYLIPYENRKNNTVECQLIVGYRGLIELARRSGFITTIQAEVVREGDAFDLEYGTVGAVFKHVPKSKADARIIGAWALARFKDEGHQFVYMTRDEIDAIRGRSRAGNNGPWVSDFGEMAKKTVLRRLCKLLPLTPEIEEQIAVADRTEFNFEQIAADPIGAVEAADNPVEQAKSAVGAAADALEKGASGDAPESGDEQTAAGQTSLIAEGQQAQAGTVDRTTQTGRRGSK